MESINSNLNDYDPNYSYADGVYTFNNDSQALYLEELIKSDYPETLTTERRTVIVASFKSNQNIASIISEIKEMPGVIDVLDSVSGQLLIKTQGKSYLNFNSQAIQSIRIQSIRIDACRAIFTPTDFRPDVQIEGLSVSGNSYIFTSNDSYSFFNTAYEMHQKVIAAYDNKTFIKKEYDYGCFVIPNKGLLREMQLNLFLTNGLELKQHQDWLNFIQLIITTI